MKPFAALAFDRNRSRTEVVAELRRLLPRMESTAATERRAISFGLPAFDSHLPQGGLAFGALHEVAPETDSDLPAAFGFAVAILGRMPRGLLLLVASPRGFSRNSRPHGHGLNGLGFDPARVILVETANETQALWAVEEALRSAAPAAVAGMIGAKLDFRTGQRLHLAAGDSGVPLVLLRPADALGTTVAMTRWRVASIAAARDRFGLIARWRWRVRLERCRNGRVGEWLVEFDHAAHRFSLAAALADPALSLRASA
jgi:protein ImuA